MRIILVEDFFHPDAGYTLNALSKCFSGLGHEVTVVTSEEDKVPQTLTCFFGTDHLEDRDTCLFERYGVRIIRLPIWTYKSGRAIVKKSWFRTIKGLDPDIVLISGNDTFCAMRYLLNRKHVNVPFLFDSHMLEMASENKFSPFFRFFYRSIFAKIIVREKILVVRVQDDPYVEKCLGIPLKQAPYIPIGSDTELFYPDRKSGRQFRQKYNIDEDIIVITYAGKLDESKGGLFLASAIRDKLKTNKKVVFLIVGNTSGEYGERVESELSCSENEVYRLPTFQYADLPQLYQASDFVVFPKQCSLSFFDVQACGVPVLFENNTVNRIRVQDNNAFLFETDNMDSFRNALVSLVNMDENSYQQASVAASKFIEKEYSWNKIATEYLKIMKDTISRYQTGKKV